jgi:hypothetical protein
LQTGCVGLGETIATIWARTDEPTQHICLINHFLPAALSPSDERLFDVFFEKEVLPWVG